jgi:large subunit ribosomal protein L30
MTKLRITYTKSAIGYSQDQKDTVRSLGLRKLNSTALHDDTPSIRGMAFKVRHLVKVEELADDAAVEPAKATVRPVKTTLVATPVAKKSAVTKAPAVAEAVPVAKPKIVEEPVVAETLSVAETPAQADNLELIEGIGPKIAAVLAAAGIVTFADLAAADTSRLTEILQQEPNLRLADSGTWSEQAALAAAGKWDEFKVLTEQLKGGRRA